MLAAEQARCIVQEISRWSIRETTGDEFVVYHENVVSMSSVRNKEMKPRALAYRRNRPLHFIDKDELRESMVESNRLNALKHVPDFGVGVTVIQ
jgi:hypothetical protein